MHRSQTPQQTVQRCRQQQLLVCTGFLVAMLIGPRAASGQITFERGTARYDTLYPTVEHCLGMLKRVEGATKYIDTVLWDTFPARLQMVPNTKSPILVAEAKQCSEKFKVESLLAPDSLGINEMMNAFTLFYIADKIPEVFALAEGWITKIPTAQDSLRNALRTRMAEYALGATPTRFDVIRRLTDSIDMKEFWWDRVRLYGEMAARAIRLRDTVALAEIDAWLLDTPKLLGDSILQTARWTDFGKGVGRYVLRAKMYAQQAESLARLRESTVAYQKYQDSLRASLGITAGSNPAMKKPAEHLVVDHWFPQNPAGERPTRGKVSIVYSMTRNICNPCRYDRIRRLAKKFPEIEITLFAGTKGHYGWEFGALSAPEEARLIDSMHRIVYGFPGMVAVHNGKFWRLPDLDRRVVDEPGPNQAQFKTVKEGPYDFFAYHIIDRDGKFVGSFGGSAAGGRDDEALELILEAVLAQSKP